MNKIQYSRSSSSLSQILHWKQPLRVARRSTAKIFSANVDESLTQCEQEYLEYSIDTGSESLRMKINNKQFLLFQISLVNVFGLCH